MRQQHIDSIHSALILILWLAGLLAGVVIGILFSIYIGESALEKWQALIAIFFSIIAATGTILVVVYQTRTSLKLTQDQINAQREIENEKRCRKMLAARAVMPHDLNEIADYSKKCISEILNLIKLIKDSQPPNFVQPPEIEYKIISNIQYAIEHMDSDVAEIFADILAHYQFQKARLSGAIPDVINGRVSGVNYAEGRLIGAIASTLRMYIYSVKLFPYARRQESSVRNKSMTSDEVDKAIFFMDIDNVLSSQTQANLKKGLLEGVY